MTETERVSGLEMIYGRHPVRSALDSGKRDCVKLLLADTATGREMEYFARRAEQLGVPVEMTGREGLEQKAGRNASHQGVILYCRRSRELHWKDLLEQSRLDRNAVVVFVDRVEDPRNLGALIRSAREFSARALIISRARTAPLEAKGVKAAAGAVETLDVIQINGFADVLEAFQQGGYWIVALDAGGDQTLWETDLTAGPLGVVIGGENQGIRRRVREMADWTVRIPLSGEAGSLNTSVALGIGLYEVRRQRAFGTAGESR